MPDTTIADDPHVASEILRFYADRKKLRYFAPNDSNIQSPWLSVRTGEGPESATERALIEAALIALGASKSEMDNPAGGINVVGESAVKIARKLTMDGIDFDGRRFVPMGIAK